MPRRTLGFLLILAVMGAGWGLTQPLTKIAVSAGYRPLGLIFWQLTLGAAILAGVRSLDRVRGPARGDGRPGLKVPALRRDVPALRIYLIIALIGTVLPNMASYESMRHLPSGIVSILLSLIPMFAFPVALGLGNEVFEWRRLAGLLLGLVGVLLIVAPEASLPDRALVVFIPLAMIGPMFYALEGNVVARWGTAGLSAIEVLYGASLLGACIALPLAIATGHFIDPRPPWGMPELAIVLSGLIHVMVYTTYVWMVGAAGPVFSVQVSYLVTGFGVLWAVLILDEGYSGWIWAAMGVILTGVFLVQPRQKSVLAAPDHAATIIAEPR